jgi:hypothetical protein
VQSPAASRHPHPKHPNLHTPRPRPRLHHACSSASFSCAKPNFFLDLGSTSTTDRSNVRQQSMSLANFLQVIVQLLVPISSSKRYLGLSFPPFLGALLYTTHTTRPVLLQNTTGQECFWSLSTAFFPGADAALLMFSSTSISLRRCMPSLDGWSELCACAPLVDEDIAPFFERSDPPLALGVSERIALFSLFTARGYNVWHADV